MSHRQYINLAPLKHLASKELFSDHMAYKTFTAYVFSLGS